MDILTNNICRHRWSYTTSMDVSRYRNNYKGLYKNLTYLISINHGTIVLGSKVDKPSEFSIKKLNIIEYIELDIQNIDAPRTENHIIWYV